VTTVEGADDAKERVAAPQAVVLETKLTRPRVRAEHIARRDLLGVLRSGSHRLTLLAAPPGFGKTTLLTEGRRTGPRSRGCRSTTTTTTRPDSSPT
jgi:hypothetical protein